MSRMRLAAMLEATVRDLRHALRLLCRNPAFAVTAILTIGLGTFPLAATLGLANSVFFLPAPGVTGADRLVSISFATRDSTGDLDSARISYATHAVLTDGAQSLEGLAGHTEGSVSIAAAGVDARYVDAAFVTESYFPVLGIRMAAGRPFTADEDRAPAGMAVAVIGHALATTMFGEPAESVGKSIRVNGLDFTVVGVAPPGFRGLKNDHFAQIWIPGATHAYTLHSPRDQWDRNRVLFRDFVGRLAPEAGLEQARAELLAATRALAVTNPAENANFATAEVQMDFEPGMSFSSRNTRGPVSLMVTMFASAGALLLLLAGANVGNLMLFRGARRRDEMALRSALGASRWQLLRAHLVEVSLISLAGGAVGLLFTVWLAKLFEGLIIPSAGFLALPIDWRVAGLVLIGAAAVGLVFGAAPAIFGSARRGLAVTVHGTAHGRGRRLRGSLTIMQLALSLALLVGAALLLATVRNLVRVDVGFDPAPIASARISPIDNGYDDRRSLVLYREIVARAGAMPGIGAISISGDAPILGSAFRQRIQAPAGAGETSLAVVSPGVTSDYFRVLGQTVRGRSFTEDESFAPADGTCGPVIVSESLATRLFGARDAIDRVVLMPRGGSRPAMECAIVGVAADVRWDGPGSDWTPILYRPLGRSPLYRATILARSDGPLSATSASLRDALASIDPALPLFGRSSLTDGMQFRLAGQRIVSSVLGSLAVLGLLMAAVGLYGLVAETVVDRTREFAVRMSIGAGPRAIIWTVLRRAVVLAAIGIVAGSILAAALAIAIRSRLFGVSALEPWAYLAAAAVLTSIVILASLAPAIRATRVNLIDVLRAD